MFTVCVWYLSWRCQIGALTTIRQVAWIRRVGSMPSTSQPHTMARSTSQIMWEGDVGSGRLSSPPVDLGKNWGVQNYLMFHFRYHSLVEHVVQWEVGLLSCDAQHIVREDRGIRLLWNIGTYLPTMQHHIPEDCNLYVYSPWEIHISRSMLSTLYCFRYYRLCSQ